MIGLSTKNSTVTLIIFLLYIHSKKIMTWQVFCKCKYLENTGYSISKHNLILKPNLTEEVLRAFPWKTKRRENKNTNVNI